ncbi:hypothetical protein STCU_09232 [Strigomonas culicis]|uniref:Uncharacterized protein n=1 Tax=Strigomonas culicis TaxID=28005 RepID=S9TNT2_9TRYP|nr:hypothetical protein STCU_09232 [Strigomonas culicis]|eukprot:EPY19937.1 hypothetical protein STCU_09232 [Strigomonas culicis]
MFTEQQVSALFAGTSHSLKRSLLLLDERQPPPPPRRPAPQEGGNAPFDEMVRQLREVANADAFTEFADAWQQQIEEELRAPGTYTAKARKKGQLFPMLTRLLRTLAAVELPCGGALWWSDEGGAAPDPASAACVAALCAELVLASVGVDLLHLVAHLPADVQAALQASSSPADSACLVALVRHGQSPTMRKELTDAMDHIARLLPEPIFLDVVERLLSWLRGHRQQGARAPLPTGLLLLPALGGYAAMTGVEALMEQLERPLRQMAAQLLPDYLADEVVFARHAGELVEYYVVLSAQLVTAAEARGPRAEATVKRLSSALLLPLEQHFTEHTTRPGMSRALHAHLVQPCLRALPVMLQPGTPLSMRHIVQTAVYRLLRIVESLARAEVAHRTGAVLVSAQQKRYAALLEQSNGKVTHAVLRLVVEDRHLSMEETAARSENGHRIYKVGDGGEDSRSAYVYLDDGSVYYKVGRSKAFKRAHSVDELFMSLE